MVLVHLLPLCFVFQVFIVYGLNVDLPRIKEIIIQSSTNSNCSVFNEVMFSQLNDSVNLRLGPKSLQNVIKTQGTMTRLLDEVKMNLSSFEFNQILQSSDQSFVLKKYARRVIMEDSSCQCVSIASSAFSVCSKLQLISIGSCCLQSSSSLILTNMPVLRTVLIKSKCFIPEKETGYGEFRVWNCPQLISLTIESSCFSDIKTIELSRLSNMVSFKIGSDCFHNCSSFSLSQCEMLEYLEFPENSFPKLMNVKIEGD